MNSTDATTTIDAAEAAPAKPAYVAFAGVMSQLATIAIEATDRGDDAEFQRALAYRAAIRRLDDRWHAGERSPNRTASAKDAAP